jgi:hypothetical protein
MMSFPFSMLIISLGRCHSGRPTSSPSLSSFVARSIATSRPPPGGSRAAEPPGHPPAGRCSRTSASSGWRSLPPRPRPAAVRRGRRPSDGDAGDAAAPRGSGSGGDDGEASTATTGNDGDDYDDGGGDANYIVGISGPYLDEETYLQAEGRLLRPDGSLDLDDGGGNRPPRAGGPERRWWGGGGRTMDDAPYYPPASRIKNGAYQAAAEGLLSPAPSYSYANPKDDDDDDDDDDDRRKGPADGSPEHRRQLSDEEILCLAVAEIENGRSVSAVDPETLHEQVFAEERAYLRQSEGFRKALSSMLADGRDAESPMAKDRREGNERYNAKVLSDLMRDMDEMEEMAISREEAMGSVVDDQKGAAADNDKNNARNNDKRGVRGRNGEVLCSKCGLRVTPDMIQRAEAIEIISRGDGTGGEGGFGGAGALRRKCGEDAVLSGGVLCSACYGQRFRATDEAKLRTAVWAGGGSPSFGGGKGYSSSPRMFDEKKSNAHQWSRGDGGYDGGREWSKGFSAGDRKSGSSRGGSVRVISTSTSFDMPEEGGYGAENKSRASPPKMPTDGALPNTPSNTDSKISARIKTPSDYHQRQRSPPPRRTSSILGGGEELAKRMQRGLKSRDSDDSADQQTRAGRTLKVQRMEERNTSEIQGGEEGGVSSERANSGGESKGKNLQQSELILDMSGTHSTNYGVSIILDTSDDDKDDRNVDTNDNYGRSWVKIEDPASKRILYWNTETGEMKKMM